MEGLSAVAPDGSPRAVLAIAIWLYDRGRYDAFRTRVSGYAANGWDVLTWNASDWSVV